ncbi:MAG: hypothetical protein COV32_03275 [Candidatus Yonathbacteria bacterium CG10_big_fil_rev_8_21_14_0_10_43_136]|uniref:Transcription regulator TrmB N-terminal domain-containing protein n=2 Tax=Parcubacteria group TaxID=1794811 RepID=A0A2M7Q478_9BACT|nr:MAG: hypothetical protein AUK15_01585 [Candidatus Nomurabacteria bacterium CG2_30_43_9]PIQ35519.1 MAG: hypothetical protein COW60_03545 [Candidatus Yonathbacteria bacterium CG17_big_fil_post_rev_8_21_14_2_50_43_9]PIR40381.1 MAG: hypothetical protein COV32_03275 [Candidatus Yonathbacteria bacterium CG10_big_fil_rev_8_21_14_0_10_43_136]PIX57509.1 MAG: hypothetical protein COZ48_00340 [Candidatus Yonathbacteria bacterium CG_4_10_14_3_um_filter_43_12]PIY58203.1 MAG: hypothetical protein COY98_03
MTKEISAKLDSYIKNANKAGLSAKASTVYVCLLDEGIALSPKNIILKTKLHRQYAYDAIHELKDLSLIVSIGENKSVRYQAVSPDKILQEAEKKRLDTMDSVQSLMKLYNKSPAGVVEVISGSQAVIANIFKILNEAKEGDYLDIIGGAGMSFVKLMGERIEEYEELRATKKIRIRYIGSGEDVEYNRNGVIKNESRNIKGIENIVNVSIRPESVSFDIYEPEILTVIVKSDSAVASQRALFEILWNVSGRA